MKRPVVGIIGNSYTIESGYELQATGESNMSAVAQACDAVPLLVPSLPDYMSLQELTEVFDGFVFTGCRANIHPEEYGEEPTEAHGIFDRNRDRLTLPLIREAVDIGLPILGICRGFQEFNVAFGGSLYPEIRDLPGRMNHRMPLDGTQEEKFAYRHDVTIEKGSVFESVFDDAVVRTNSLHGQGIKNAGARIVIDGYASDGTPEALSVKDAKGFALAVQWHPEWRADQDSVSHQLFSAFGKALRAAKGN